MKELKRIVLATAVILLLFFLSTKIFGPIPFSVNSIQTTKQNLFTVTGTGEITAVPNTGKISIGVTQQGKTVEEAQNKANQAVEKVIDEIKKVGINEKKIKTINYSVNPKYNYERVTQEIVGYDVTQNLDVTVEDTSKLNNVIDAATKSGANMVGGVSFVFSDEKQKDLEKKAREEAIRDAKQKANDLAKAAGIKLGKIIDVTENKEGSAIARPIMAKEGLGGSLSVANDTAVTPGENKVTISVALSYETY